MRNILRRSVTVLGSEQGGIRPVLVIQNNIGNLHSPTTIVDELLDSVKMINEILTDYNPTGDFDDKLFTEIIEKITVESSASLAFTLIGGINFTENIPEKERCKVI